MCGISGEIRFDGLPASTVRIERMNQKMVSRGPDEGGVFAIGARAFGHRRLMIMDLSERSQQPMYDAALGLGIVFNGAIYNYPELRETLKGLGYSFYSSGDTEVILKAYHAWGAACVERFSGMFAFAIWERDSGDTFLARDRLGIKPLYYFKDDSACYFASTLPAVLACEDISKEIDPIALNYYLNFHAVVPAPHTIISGVRKIPPGHCALIKKDGSMRLDRYWSLEFNSRTEEKNYSYEQWQEGLLAHLRRAVKQRLVAAVDVGVLLSGGVDSSLLVGLIAQADVAKFKTYSVGFESVGDELGDEFKYSDIIAQHFATDHHQIRVSSQELLTHLPSAIDAMSEPMVSHDCIGFYLLSREVAKTCRAVQSGQGADEVFGGYHWYPPLVGSTEPVATYREAFFDRAYAEYCDTVTEQFRTDDHALQYVTRHFNQVKTKNPVEKALHLDTTVMLVDDPVKRVDNMTMAWGLEARVPFLDHELVEFAARIPAQFKVSGEGKTILKDTARSVIPDSVIDRPKGYFPVPALKYLKGEVLDFVRTALTNQAATQRGLFRKDMIETLLADPMGHITPLRGSKLWQLGLLELWLQQQGI